MIERLCAITVDRKRLGADEQRVVTLWADALEREPGASCLVLRTCERVDAYHLDDGAHGVGIAAPDVAQRLHGREAVRRLFRVAAGLESRLIGETHVIGQIRAAADRAHDAGLLGSDLARLVRAALRAGRRVRAESGIERIAESYARLGARRALGAGERIGVIGTGSLARDIVRSLVEHGSASVTIFGRHEGRTRALAERFGVRWSVLARIGDQIGGLDSVITAVSTSRPIITPEVVAGAGALLVVDLGMPSNTCASLPRVAGVSRVTLDGLAPETRPASGAVELAEQLMDREIGAFIDIVSGSLALPPARPWRGGGRAPAHLAEAI